MARAKTKNPKAVAKAKKNPKAKLSKQAAEAEIRRAFAAVCAYARKYPDDEKGRRYELDMAAFDTAKRLAGWVFDADEDYNNWALGATDDELCRENVREALKALDKRYGERNTMARAKTKNPKATAKNPAQGWDVFLRGKKIDTVFYSGKNTADDIKRSLVSHDGYDSGITVRKSKMKANPVPPITTADGIITDATVLFLGPRHAVTADDELGGYAVLVRDDKDQDDWNAWRWLKTVPTIEQATDPDAPYTAGAENNPSGRSLERYSPAELRNMSSISSGHTDDLKAEQTVGGTPTRFWLSRMTVEDGETNAVHVEQLKDGRWEVVHSYGRPKRS